MFVFMRIWKEMKLDFGEKNTQLTFITGGKKSKLSKWERSIVQEFQTKLFLFACEIICFIRFMKSFFFFFNTS